MLDISHTLINKLTLRFTRKTSLTKSINTADMVKGILYDRFSEIYHLTSEWKHFSFGGKLISEDEMLKGQSVSMTVDDVHTWAAYLNVKDPDFIRRRWVYYIGLKSDDGDSAILYYAKCCYDHMAGSLQESKTPIEDFDQTPVPLFSNNHISCMCGSNILPHQAIELTHSNLPDLINLLTDSERRQPVVLVTCISYLSPEKIAAMLLGNAAVFWTDNSSTVMRLNSLLPQSMYTIWKSVRIFMPDAGEKTYNPIYTLEDIREMGLDKFYAGIRQAYSQSMRSEERRVFPTIDSIYSAKQRQQIEVLTQQLAVRDAKLSTVIGQNRELRKSNELLLEQNRELASAKPTEDTLIYEKMIDESIKANDALKSAIEQLNALLCSDMGLSFQPDSSAPIAIVQELAHTIHACLHRAADKK